MKLLRFAAASLFSLLFCSCSVLRVQQGKDKLPGLPFYPKIGVCRHEVVWAVPVYTLHLKSFAIDRETAKEEEVADLGTINISRSTYANSNPVECPIKDLLKYVANGNGKDLISTWTSLFENKCSFDPLDQGIKDKNNDIVLVSNTNTLQPQVDYRHVYYINAQHPFAGSAKVDAKLNADGSLSEGSGEVDDRTFEAVVSLLSAPFGGATSSTATTPTVKTALKATGTGATYTTYRLDVTSSALLYTLTQSAGPINPSDKATCQAKPKPAIDDSNYNLVISLVPADATAKAAKNTVKISGEVKLPEKQ